MGQYPGENPIFRRGGILRPCWPTPLVDHLLVAAGVTHVEYDGEVDRLTLVILQLLDESLLIDGELQGASGAGAAIGDVAIALVLHLVHRRVLDCHGLHLLPPHVVTV